MLFRSQLAVDDVALNAAHGGTIQTHALDDFGLGVIVLEAPLAVGAAFGFALADEGFFLLLKSCASASVGVNQMVSPTASVDRALKPVLINSRRLTLSRP